MFSNYVAVEEAVLTVRPEIKNGQTTSERGVSIATQFRRVEMQSKAAESDWLSFLSPYLFPYTLTLTHTFRLYK